MAIDPNTKIDPFADYIVEDVEHCETVDVLGGLRETEIYYCYLRHIETLRIPSAISTNDYAGKIRQEIACQENRGFKKMTALVDTGELSARFSPNSKSQDSAELEFFLLGSRAELIGLSRKLRNRPFVFIIKDRNGRQFVCGTLVSPAYLNAFSIGLGKVFDDNNGATFSVKSNSIFYEYLGNIPVIDPEELDGDYSDDYSDDYD